MDTYSTDNLSISKYSGILSFKHTLISIISKIVLDILMQMLQSDWLSYSYIISHLSVQLLEVVCEIQVAIMFSHFSKSRKNI